MEETLEPILTQVAAGTPLGRLLRRYWQPVALVSELTEEHAIHAVQVLGERLVLYRTANGSVGLMEAWCTHRGYAMTYGWVEEASVACGFHGWQFDLAGNCFIGYAKRVYPIPEGKATAYPVVRRAGLYWAYLGPQPTPAFPEEAAFTRVDLSRRLTVLPVDDHPLLQAAPAPEEGLRLRRAVDDSHTWEVILTVAPAADGNESDPWGEQPEATALEAPAAGERAFLLPWGPAGMSAGQSDPRAWLLDQLEAARR